MSELSNPDTTTNSTNSDINPGSKKSPGGAFGRQHGFKPEAMTTRSKDADSLTRKKSHSPIIMKEEWILTPLKKSSADSRKRPSSSLSSKDSSDKELSSKENIKEKSTTLPPPPFKKRKNGQEYNHDYYCWICHREGTSLQCELCPRIFHIKCVDLLQEPDGEWVCVECEKSTNAECTDTQSRAMSMLTIDQLAYLLKCALGRMKHAGADAFLKPVSLELFPTYEHYIYNPMDLSTLEKNIKKKMYGCTEAFLSDAKWIVHNCIVFNGYHHKFTAGAKMIVKICKHEMSEIEVCPDCYMSSCTQNENWFCEPCRKPHILVWAKLKGFPFWPAKALRTADGNIDVRFFGAHDRAWIPDSQCYVLSKTIPTPVKNKKKGGYEQSMEELDLHIQRLRETYGHFEYAPFRTPFDTDKPLRQVDPSRRLNDFPKIENITAKRFKTVSKTPKRNYFASSLPSPNYSVRESSGNNTKTLNKLTNDSKKNGLHKIKMELVDENSKEIETPRIRTRERVVSRYSTSPRNTNTKPREPLPTPGVEEIDSDKSKNVPTGVFVSDKLDIKLKSLELNIPKLDKSKISKPSLENIKKLEILTSAINDDDEEEEEINNITPKHSPPISTLTKLLEDSQSSAKSQSLPLSSPLPKLEDDELSLEMPSPDSLSTDVKQSPSKKNSLFTIQLDKTIASCKAKLGIDESSENHLQTNEESEDEDNSGSNKSEIVNNKDKNENDNRDEEEKSSVSAESCKSSGSTSDDQSKSDSEDKSLEESYKTNKKEFPMENSETISSVKIDENPIKICSKTDHSKDEMRTTCDSTLSSKISIKQTSSGEKIEQSKEQEHAGLDMDCESEGELVINLGDETSDYKEKTSVQTKTAENKLDLTNVPWNKQKFEEETALQSPQENKTDTDELAVNNPIIDNVTKEIDPIIAITTSGSQPSSTISNKNNFIASQTTISDIEVPRSAVMSSPPLAALSPSAFDFSKYTDKVLSFVKNTFEEMIHEFYPLTSEIPTDQNMKARLTLEIEKLRWRHQQEVSETKHNSDLTLFEMRACLEAEKQQMLNDLRKQLEQDKIKIIEDTKKKQWCAHCGKEALFYCCWNTSYCDYPCQQSHWPQHMITCTQSQSGENTKVSEKGNTLSNQVQKAVNLQRSPIHSANSKTEIIKHEQKPTASDKESGSGGGVMPTKVECTPQLEFMQTNNKSNLTTGSSSVQSQYLAHSLSSPSPKTTVQTIRITGVPNISRPLTVRPEKSGQPSIPTLTEPHSLISQGKVLYPVLHPQGKCALPKQIVIAQKVSIPPNNVQQPSIQLQLRPV